MKPTLTAISKWALTGLMLALFTLSGGMAWADSEASESASPAPTEKATILPRHDESESKDSEQEGESESDESGTDEDDDSGINEEQIDLDAAREALESRYENPADVALPPKILVPNDDLIPRTKIKTGAEIPQRLPFNVFQLRHERHDLMRGEEMSNSFSAQKQTAQINAIPVNIDSVQFVTHTPAEEFFTQASVLTAGLGSSAVALSAFVLMRGRRKDGGDL